MRIQLQSFKTKVARRTFLLFILCAALPLAASAGIGFFHIRAQIDRQGREQLEETCRSLSSSLYERLFILRAEMRVLAGNLCKFQSADASSFALVPEKDYAMRFLGLAMITANGERVDLIGRMRSIPHITPVQHKYLRSGHAVLAWECDKGKTSIYMILSAPDQAGMSGTLIAEIQPEYLVSASQGLPPFTDFAVMDPSNCILFRSSEEMSVATARAREKALTSHAGFLSWGHDGTRFIGSFRSIFLKPNFHCPEWIVLLIAEREAFLQPGTSFTWSYVLLVLFTTCLVFFLSVTMIRKSTGPIEELKEATDRISQGELDHRVQIDSQDEFEDLGKSFNEMSRRIQEGQEMLVRASKMSVMGQMAAGVMHEVKQPLTAVYGLLELNLYEKDGKKRQANDEKALKAVERLDAILSRFKSFSYISQDTFQPVSLPPIIQSVYELMEHQFKRQGIRVELDLDPRAPLIQGDPQELQQVVSNLVINAMDALEEKTGDRSLRMGLHRAKGRVILFVQDNGPGIPEELKDRIFEPFFTTKKEGRGSGLGMAIITYILHKHSANISVESKVGEGAMFTISFVPLGSRGAGEPSGPGESTPLNQNDQEEERCA
jgi:signal transduction histidine kinase